MLYLSIRHYALLALFCVGNLCAQGQKLTDLPILSEPILGKPNPAVSTNYTPPIAANLDAALDASFDSMFQLSGLVGLSAAVNLPDGRIWTRAKGTNVDFPTTQLLPDDPIGMGSITKTMVATLMLKAQEDGLLDLDDAISVYLNPIQNVNPTTTIRQLLNHTSGIANYTDNPAYSDAIDVDITRTWAVTEVLQFIQAPNFPPGQSWSYSNTNYVLAGLILEKTRQQPLEELLRYSIILPLGMENTFLMPQETAPNKPIAHIWVDITNDGVPDDIHLLVPDIDAFFSSAWAAGAVVSTPKDLSVFIKAVFGGQLLQASSLAEMQDFILLDAGLGLGYGLGCLRIQDPVLGKRSWGHNGYILYQSEANYLPDLNLSVAVQSNDADPNASQNATVQDVYRALVLTYCTYQLSSPTYSAINKAENVVIYPNPAQNRIFAPDLATAYQIFNQQGTLVQEGNCTPKSEIRLDHLSSGAYIFLFTGQKVQYSRFIKVD